MGRVSNFENSYLGGINSHCCPSSNLASKLGSQIDPVSSTSHSEQNSFEIQIQEIDMELNKFDSMAVVNPEAKD